MERGITLYAYPTPADQSLSRECHPELSLALMNGGQGLTDRKSTRAGCDARLHLARSAQRSANNKATHFPGVRDKVEKHRSFRGDVIDAFALLWAARRLRDGIARALPDLPVRDSRGLAMQIWV